MKVAVVSQYFPTSRQPWAGHSAYQTLRLLAKRCELKVFYPEAVYPSALAPKSWLGTLDRTWSPADVPVDYIPYSTLPAIARPLNGFAMARKLRRPVEGFDPDIILNYVVYPDGYAATRLGAALHKPVVLTAIGSDLNRISDPLCGVLTRSALRHANATITVSRHLGRVAVDLGSPEGQTRPILNGCDTDVFHPRDRSNARRELGVDTKIKAVVYVGRTDVRKGLIELIDAFPHVSQSFPQARLFLVGDGPDRTFIEQKIQSSSTAQNVSLIPSCPTEKIAQWMAAADVVTLPSYAEGCPNVVIESLCSGRPVVATNVGGIPELMDSRSGCLVEPRSVSALTKGLQMTLNQSWDAGEIAARHRRSWQDVANDVLDTLRHTIDVAPHG